MQGSHPSLVRAFYNLEACLQLLRGLLSWDCVWKFDFLFAETSTVYHELAASKFTAVEPKEHGPLFDLKNSKVGRRVGFNISFLFGSFTPICQITNCICWWLYRRAGINGPKWPLAQPSSIGRGHISRSLFLLPCWASSNQPEVVSQHILLTLYISPTKSLEHMELLWLSKTLIYVEIKYRVFSSSNTNLFIVKIVPDASNSGC